MPVVAISGAQSSGHSGLLTPQHSSMMGLPVSLLDPSHAPARYELPEFKGATEKGLLRPSAATDVIQPNRSRPGRPR